MLLFLPSAAALLFLLIDGLQRLPGFGHYPGPYGMVLNGVGVPQRHATNLVTAVNFDYRARETARRENASEALRALALAFVAALIVLGGYVVAHGALTPGGGFQGGVV